MSFCCQPLTVGIGSQNNGLWSISSQMFDHREEPPFFDVRFSYMDFRKGEWHSAWGSAVQHRWCERGHKQARNSLQRTHPFCLDLLAAIMLTFVTLLPGGRGRGGGRLTLSDDHLWGLATLAKSHLLRVVSV